MGILIAMDGVDASGKETQTNMLYKRLIKDGYSVRKLSFPMYDNLSSSLVKMYLAGEFGENPVDVNAYAASTFFAADRFATYRTDWGNDYTNNTIILADRYVASNMIHQACKIDDPKKRREFFDWIYDLEYRIYGVPKPKLSIFLDMPVSYGLNLMKERANKIDGSQEKDIHEKNSDYLHKSYAAAVEAAEQFDWTRVRCVQNSLIRSVDDIHEEIYAHVKVNLNNCK